MHLQEEGEESPEPGRSFFDRFKVRPGSIGGCAFNLCSATLGAGSLSLPYAFRCSGMVLALILLFLGALSTIFSIFLLLEARRLTGKQSYEDLANYLYGKRFQKLVEFAIIIFCFGTAAAYIIAIGDILEPVAEAISAPGWLNRNLLMALFWLCVMLPLSMVEKVNSLTWTSLMGILSISFLVIAASAHAIQTIDRDGWRTVRGISVLRIRSFLPSFLLFFDPSHPPLLFPLACPSWAPPRDRTRRPTSPRIFRCSWVHRS